MKKIVLSVALVVTGHAAFTQLENSSMADEFKEISKFSSRQSGFEGIQTYSSGIVNGSPYFSTDWCRGSVTTIFHETFKDYLFLFDKYRQELFMKWKDSSVVLLADKNQINSFTLQTDKTHTFVTSGIYDSARRGFFFEALVSNEQGYSLLKLVKTKYVEGDPRDIEKQRLGEIYDSYQDVVTYYLSFKKRIPQKITLKEKSFVDVMASKKNAIVTYFDAHKNDQKDEFFFEHLVELVNQ